MLNRIAISACLESLVFRQTHVKKAFAANPVIISEGTQAPEGTPPAGGSGVAMNAEEIATYKAMGYTEEELKKVKEGKK